MRVKTLRERPYSMGAALFLIVPDGSRLLSACSPAHGTTAHDAVCWARHGFGSRSCVWNKGQYATCDWQVHCTPLRETPAFILARGCGLSCLSPDEWAVLCPGLDPSCVGCVSGHEHAQTPQIKHFCTKPPVTTTSCRRRWSGSSRSPALTPKPQDAECWCGPNCVTHHADRCMHGFWAL